MGFSILENNMPYPNEYAARIHEPGKYKEMRREKGKFGPGIDVIFGITEEGKAEVQAIRFAKSKFTGEEVKSWLSKHNYSAMKIEAPSESQDAVEEAVLFDKMGDILVDVDMCDYIPATVKGTMETTPEGFLKFVAPIARVGVYKYVLPDGTIRRDLVDEETLFDSNAMKTMELKPFTDGHPNDLLDPVNVRQHRVGNTGEKIFRDEMHLMSSLIVQDQKAIEAIKTGAKRQLSPGYKATLLVQPGTYNGENYDTIQRNRVYNHLALCTKARGGDTLALNVDNVDGESFNQPILNIDKGETMPKIRINGIDYEAAQEVINHVDSLTGRLTQSEQTVATVKDSLDQTTKTLKDTADEFKKFKDSVPQMISASVKERTRLEKIARNVVTGDAAKTIESLDSIGLKGLIVKAKHPSLDITGKDESYVSALIDAIEVTPPAQQQTAMDQLSILQQKQQNRPVVNSDEARQAHADSLKEGWKKDPRTGK